MIFESVKVDITLCFNPTPAFKENTASRFQERKPQFLVLLSFAHKSVNQRDKHLSYLQFPLFLPSTQKWCHRDLHLCLCGLFAFSWPWQSCVYCRCAWTKHLPSSYPYHSTFVSVWTFCRQPALTNLQPALSIVFLFQMCLNPALAIHSGDMPSPLYICSDCVDFLRDDHSHYMVDLLLPMPHVSTTCENKVRQRWRKSRKVH